MHHIQKGPGGPVTSRRTIVRTAAWAVPVVAAVSAAPMAAASSEPVWDPTSNGTGGNLVYSGATNTITGYQEAWLGLDGAVPGTVDIPRLTATFTRSGAWGSPAPSFLGPAQQSLSVGSTLTVSSGFIWVVTSIDSTTLIISGGPARIPGSATEVRTPRIRIRGVGDNSGGSATMGVTLTGGDGNDSGGTSSVQVGRPPAAARRAAADEDADSGDPSGGTDSGSSEAGSTDTGRSGGSSTASELTGSETDNSGSAGGQTDSGGSRSGWSGNSSSDSASTDSAGSAGDGTDGGSTGDGDY